MADDLPKLSNPALNALYAAGIRSLAQIAKHTEAEILALHGVGPSTIPTLRAALRAAGRSFATPIRPGRRAAARGSGSPRASPRTRR